MPSLSSPPLSLSAPSPFLKSRFPLFQLGDLGSTVNSLSGVWGKVAAEIDFDAF